MEDKLFVAVGKEVKEGKSILVWALQNSRGKKICIVYVHIPAQMIPMPMGGKFPVSKVGVRELKAFRDKEQQEMLSIFDSYLQICVKAGVHAEKMPIEIDSSIEEGIIHLISRERVGRLVMGAAANRSYSRKMVEPKSKKAIYVRNHAPDYCHIWFVCKGYLIYTREAVTQPNQHIEETPSIALGNDQPDAGSTSQDLVSRLRLSGFSGYDGSSVDFGQSSRVSFSQSSVYSAETESVYSSPHRLHGLELLALPQSQDAHLVSAPPIETQRSKVNDHLYDQLEQAMTEAENSRHDAFQESMRRRKAEKEALDAIRKTEASERMYYDELRLRKATEEEFAKAKGEFEHMRNLYIKVSQELHDVVDQKVTLKNLLEKSNLTIKELEEKFFNAVELLQKYRSEQDGLQIERDNALKEAENLTMQLAKERSSSNTPVFFSVFAASDLQKATNYFDPNLKIGEGGYGSIYKGFLHHTEVAIKILNPNSMQGPREFDQEVDVLSKLRHPNLVALVGACQESYALVYEYLPGGNLEDRLICKDNASPIPWQTRIRIATELCSALIFLHSSRPNCIIHGDLKPSNILLDDNCVCKLSDFGICRVVFNGETSMEHTTLFFTTQPKGTFTYMDPEFLSTGELTPKSDVYSFGIILLRLLTGKPAMGIAKAVGSNLDKGTLDSILDSSAGEWPFVQAEQLARVALRCCDMNRKNRPDLASDVWRVLEPMKASCQSVSVLRLASNNHIPSYFICPVFQEIMEDPHIASDGFTYEAEAIRGWLDSGHDTSPMTNVRLANPNLTPNRALRSAIQEWLQHNRSE